MTAHDQQTFDERTLQAQFFSRIGFVASQIKDLDFQTFTSIVEHGVRIGNPLAPCVVDADSSLRNLSVEIGAELMEIADIAKKDFLRIPNEFVHPFLDRTERLSSSFLSEVTTKLASENSITAINEMILELEEHEAASRELLITFNDDLQAEIAYKRRQMNYVKAEIFPILEYSLRYYQRGTNVIINGLSSCI